MRSPRPFAITQRYDISVHAGVMALFAQFSRKHDRDPAVLFALAYGTADTLAWDAIQEQAEWEGVVYPTTWTRQMIRHLGLHLISMNNRPLAEVVLSHLT
jgi:hypothetical protein